MTNKLNYLIVSLLFAPALYAEDVTVREFRTGDYVWSFGSLDGKAKVADNRLVLEAPNTMGGAGMEYKGGFAEHGAKIPELDLEVLPGNKAMEIRLSMPDQADNKREWTFVLDGLESGTRVRVAAKDGKPLDPAALGEPGSKYDPASIKSMAFVGDWKPTPLAVAVHAVRLIPATPELKAGQAAYLKGEREKRELEEAKHQELKEKRRQLLAGAPHPEDGPAVTDIGSVGANRIVVNLRDRESVSARQVPIKDLGEVKIREKTVEYLAYAIEKGKVVPAVPYEVVKNGESVGTLVVNADRVQLPGKTVGTALTTETVDVPDAYRIRSAADERYADGLAPTAVHRKSKPGIGGGTNRLVRHQVFLDLPHPLRKGAKYEVVFQGVNTREPSVSFVFETSRMRSPAVNVNHLGFRPDDPLKRGFLSLWLGEGGAVEFDAKSFELLDAKTFAAVHTGKVVKALDASEPENLQGANRAGTHVYHLDFSEFSEVGNYVLHVPGVGSSLSFDIAMDTYLDAYLNSMHGLLSHRSGIALGAPFTEYERPVPMKPGVNGFMAYQIDRTSLEGEADIVRERIGHLLGEPADLSRLEPVAEAWGGYMDAGDWDRRAQHLSVTRGLLELFELFPATFEKLSIPLPPEESENKIPDLLDEALWNIDFYARLQLPSGAVRGGVESTEHPRSGEASWQESLIVGVFAPDPVSTYRFADSAALAARLLKPYDAARAEDLAKRAARAWVWAEAEGKKVGEEIAARLREAKSGRTMGNMVADRLSAAVSLFALTGDSAYHHVVLDGHPALCGEDPLPHLNSIYQYLLLPEAKQDPGTTAKFRQLLVDVAEKSLKFGDGNAFGITMPVPLPLIGFVSYYSVPETILGAVLLRAHAVTGEERFLKGAVRAAQFTLGGNPMGMTLTTGQGHFGPQSPLHIDSHHTELEAPKGITVYGNTDLAGNAPDWVKQWFFRDTLYPSPDKWPAAESYQDIFVWPEMNEYTVHQSIGPMAFYLGYLHARGR